MNDIGKHVLADLHGVDPAILANEQALIFSCGTADPEVALAHMTKVLQPQMLTTTIERRGKNCRPQMTAPFDHQLAYAAS